MRSLVSIFPYCRGQCSTYDLIRWNSIDEFSNWTKFLIYSTHWQEFWSFIFAIFISIFYIIHMIFPSPSNNFFEFNRFQIHANRSETWNEGCVKTESTVRVVEHESSFSVPSYFCSIFCLLIANSFYSSRFA